MIVSQLIYVSRATAHIDRKELQEITGISATNNARKGVTGALLFCSGYFLQILEGDSAVLESLLEKISADIRHADVQVLARFDAAQRLFPDWTMASLHESSMTRDQFDKTIAWTRLISRADMTREIGRDAQSLLVELRSAIAAEYRSIMPTAA